MLTRRCSDHGAVAQKLFQWQSDAEIDATPIRVVRYVEKEADIWSGLCKQ